jgi:hypothetical protein
MLSFSSLPIGQSLRLIPPMGSYFYFVFFTFVIHLYYRHLFGANQSLIEKVRRFVATRSSLSPPAHSEIERHSSVSQAMLDEMMKVRSRRRNLL